MRAYSSLRQLEEKGICVDEYLTNERDGVFKARLDCKRWGKKRNILRHHYPRELSGGERQRVAIARAVYGKTRVIMADQPTANLDSRQSLKAATLLKDCCRTYHQTILMATHNPVIAQVCDRAVHLENGVLTEG